MNFGRKGCQTKGHAGETIRWAIVIAIHELNSHYLIPFSVPRIIDIRTYSGPGLIHKLHKYRYD